MVGAWRGGKCKGGILGKGGDVRGVPVVGDG